MSKSSDPPTPERRPTSVPLHERFAPWGWLRSRMREWVFREFHKLTLTDDGKTILANSLRGLLHNAPPPLGHELASTAPPYAGLGQARLDNRTDQRTDIVFITGRFRSGSTLLWNLFRQIPGCTSYYEPFNERRWFDPAHRGTHTDQTHRHAEAYWLEYDGMTVLGDYYREEWIDRNLYMDERFWDPLMKRYIEILIERAPGRPVLQFNRVDFRLPWFRWYFPHATILHLYRHPRDQWCSTLRNLEAFPKEKGFAEYAPHDHFYLRNWTRDLRYHFPFLEEQHLTHPYELFYLIWRLSYLFGRKFAHTSLAYEELVQNPEERIAALLNLIDLRDYDLNRLTALIVRPEGARWRRYAEESWFQERESHCENLLAEYFGILTDRTTNESHSNLR